jgi:hypothetical protein
MKAIIKLKAIVGLVSLAAMGQAWGQTALPVQNIYDVEMLADGTMLYAGDFRGFCDGSDPECAAPPAAGVVDWHGQVLSCVDDIDLAIVLAGSAQRLANGNTLIADTGNNRVIEVDANGLVQREHDSLSQPTDARRLANGNTLLVDSGNHRVVEVNAAGQIAWQFGTTGVAGTGARLREPSKAERLPNGNTLLIDTGNHRVIEVNANRQIVRSFASGLSAPHAAVRLANGNTLIADTGNNRIVEMTSTGALVRTIATGTAVYDVERLANGNTLCSGEFGIREYNQFGQVVNEMWFNPMTVMSGGQ